MHLPISRAPRLGCHEAGVPSLARAAAMGCALGPPQPHGYPVLVELLSVWHFDEQRGYALLNSGCLV